MDTTDVSFTAQDVMALRQKTGLGMMDCKSALAATRGDMTAAEEWLRQKLKGKMAARTERATGQGRIGIAVKGRTAAIVEVRTETDFSARSPDFIALVDDLAQMALKSPPGELKATGEMSARVEATRIKTRENVNYARGFVLEAARFGRYVHHDGKRAAVLAVDGTADDDLLTGLCQHIVAHVPPPIAVTEQEVPAEIIQKIRAEARQEAIDSGKPAEMVEKIAEGKVRKQLQQYALLEQLYVRDPSGKALVKSVLPKGLTIRKFVRYTVGG